MIASLLGGFTPAMPRRTTDSIATMERIQLGGIEQWITLRGHSVRNPILLYLHGGPGAPQQGAFRKFNSSLEAHFLVVHWDQRGSGKNFGPHVHPDSMTLEQILAEIRELIETVTTRFGQQRVFLVGQSVGAAYGLLTAQRHPELLHAFVGVNQPVHRRLEEQMSYEWLLTEATAQRQEKCLRALQQIGAPNEHGLYRSVDDLVIQRQWLTKLGGVTYAKNATKLALASLLTPELTFREKRTYLKGLSFSMNQLWPSITALNFFEQIPRVDVPVYFCMGQHDRIVHDLAASYIAKLEAPYQELVPFTQSGHLALFEQPELFHDVMVKRVLRRTQEHVSTDTPLPPVPLTAR